MALKDSWVDKIDGVDDVLAKDINNIAQAVISTEKTIRIHGDVIRDISAALESAVDDTLIAQYTLEPSGTIEEIKTGYTNSFGVAYFNRPPVEGDIFYCLGRTTGDRVPFAMTARIIGFSGEGKNAVFEAIEVVPLVAENIEDIHATRVWAHSILYVGDESVIIEEGKINICGDDAKLLINDEDVIGDISTALDSIIAIQNALIGGESV